jgi:hypothetical protein
MLVRFFLLFSVVLTLHACTSTPSPQQSAKTTLVDTTSSSVNQNIFEDNFGNEKKLYEAVFSSLLDSTYYKNPSLFLENLGQTYGQPNIAETSVLAFEQQALFGLEDSIWFVNCLSPADTSDSCAFQMLQTQYLFDNKGHLFHKSEAAVAQFIPIVLDSMPIYMTITNDCDGNGQHHFYVYQQGKLIDIFNVLMNNSPKTYDINPEGGLFRKEYLETLVQDLNEDGFNDIILKGKWLVLNNGKGRKYPVTRPFKAEPVEHHFLYNPTKEVFVFKE